MARKNVQNARFSKQFADLHRSLIDIVSVINRPQGDEMLIQKAGIRLDRALFPLLVGIERFGPLGVVDLAERAGRDYTTVSRQVAKLESLGLVTSRAGAADRRVREIEVAAKGKAMVERVDAARERIGRAIFSSWETSEVDELVRLTRKLADGMMSAQRVTATAPQAAAKSGRK